MARRAKTAATEEPKADATLAPKSEATTAPEAASAPEATPKASETVAAAPEKTTAEIVQDEIVKDGGIKRVVHANLNDAVNGVMEELSYIRKRQPKKGGEDKGLPYSFASEADIVGSAHPLFVRHGLTIRPKAHKIIKDETYTTDRGKTAQRIIIESTFKVVHGKSNETDDVVSLGEASDYSDKVTSKAQTIAYKYAIRQLLMLETGDDPDNIPPGEMDRSPKGGSSGGGRSQTNAASKDQHNEERYKECLSMIDKATTGDELYRFEEAAKKVFDKARCEEVRKRCEARWEVIKPKEQKKEGESSGAPQQGNSNPGSSDDEAPGDI